MDALRLATGPLAAADIASHASQGHGDGRFRIQGDHCRKGARRVGRSHQAWRGCQVWHKPQRAMVGCPFALAILNVGYGGAWRSHSSCRVSTPIREARTMAAVGPPIATMAITPATQPFPQVPTSADSNKPVRATANAPI
jgi:hypothetical protein